MRSDNRAIVAALAIALVGFATAAKGSDDGIYESIDNVAIGRVFLTPAQRAILDELRLLPPAESRTAATANTDPETRTPHAKTAQPAGYIQSSSGPRREWSGSDFVATEGIRAAPVAFPGDVKIVRHSSADDTTETAGDEERD